MNAILIIGFVALFFILRSILKVMERIEERLMMTDQEKHEHNLSVDEPEVWEEMQLAKLAKRNK